MVENTNVAKSGFKSIVYTYQTEGIIAMAGFVW